MSLALSCVPPPNQHSAKRAAQPARIDAAAPEQKRREEDETAPGGSKKGVPNGRVFGFHLRLPRVASALLFSPLLRSFCIVGCTSPSPRSRVQRCFNRSAAPRQTIKFDR